MLSDQEYLIQIFWMNPWIFLLYAYLPLLLQTTCFLNQKVIFVFTKNMPLLEQLDDIFDICMSCEALVIRVLNNFIGSCFWSKIFAGKK